MNFFRPWIRSNAKTVTIFFLILGLIAAGIGTYFTFFQGKNYVKATAVITSVAEEDDLTSDDANAKKYIPTVKYTADGKSYETELGAWTDGWKVGTQVKIKYNPNDPTDVISDSPGFGLYLLIIGAVIAVVALFMLIKNAKAKKEIQEENAGPVFKTERQTIPERELYFLTDLGTVKGGCHLEDAGRQTVYEAIATKYSVLTDSEYEFVNHETGERTRHMVGKSVTSESDRFLALDNYSTFTFDGVNIWKVLHKNGVKIKTDFDGVLRVYRIYFNETEIAFAKTSGRYVHEDEAEEHKVNLPIQGFFRVWTSDANPDIVFLALFAISRTNQLIYQ